MMTRAAAAFLAVALAVPGFALAQASNPTTPLTKEQIIDKLKPGAPLKFRGIRMLSQPTEASSEQATPQVAEPTAPISEPSGPLAAPGGPVADQSGPLATPGAPLSAPSKPLAVSTPAKPAPAPAAPAAPAAPTTQTATAAPPSVPKAPAAPAEVKPAAVTATAAPAAAAAKGPSIDMHIQFEFNSAKLTPEAVRDLTVLGAALQSPELQPYKFEIAGHTDAVGSDVANQKLSERRAQSVRQFLVSHFGIAATRLDAQGFGRTQPADPSNPASPINRRVQITNVGAG